MAQRKKDSSKKTKTRAAASGGTPKSGTRHPSNARARSVDGEPRVLDDRTRRDIAGVGFIIAGVVLFIAAVAPTGAIVTSFLSEALHLLFGIGCYILPFFLVAIGVTVLYRREEQRMSLRVAVGLALVLVALLATIALFTPTGLYGPARLFDHEMLVSHGGYTGACLAWVGLTLFGQIISLVIMLGVALFGIIIIGFSVTDFMEKVRNAYNSYGFEGLADAVGDFSDGLANRVSRRRSIDSGPAPARMTPGRSTGGSGYGGYGGYGAAGSAGASATSALTSRLPFEEPRRPRTAALGDLPEMPDLPGMPHMPQMADLADEVVVARGAHTQVLPTDAAGRPVTQVLGPDGALHGAVPGMPLAPEPSAPAPGAPTMNFDDVPEQSARPMTRKLGKRHRPESEAVRVSDPIPAPPVEVIIEPVSAPAMPVRGNPRTRTKSSAKAARSAQPGPEKDGFQLPSINLLASGGTRRGSSEEELAAVAADLQGTLEDFGVMAQVVGWVEGPTVTLFKVDLPSGVRVSKVTNLTDDIALALAAPGVRIFAPIPGTNYVGIEVPNRVRQTVCLPDVLAAAKDGPLQVGIGEDVEGHAIVADLAKMPHVLIAGTTGSGKSVEVNSMIMSILLRATPDEVRFIMIDPKRVEFAPYDGIPHLYVPVVTECREASSALSWAVAEMERRLKLFSKCGVRNIVSFNEKAKEAVAAAQAAEAAGEEELPENPYGEPIPYIVIVIDELADLMMNVGKEVEFSISRIAQLARAAGIHLIIATQRPSTNVVTGLIKANITCRIGLTVASGIDSRVILDTTGAENLIGRGDLLFSKPEYPKPVRIQGPWIPDEEIAAVVDHLKSQGEPEYHSEILKTNVVSLGDSSPSGDGGSEADDPMLWEAAEMVVSSGLGSTSNLQRRLKVGYARAGRIMDQLEEKGIVGPANGSRPREVLVDAMELETLKAFEANDDDF